MKKAAATPLPHAAVATPLPPAAVATPVAPSPPKRPPQSTLSQHGMVDEASVMNRYAVGDKLGDGNFAVVKV